VGGLNSYDASNNMPISDKFDLSVTIFPENATKTEIEWFSDDPSIAEVDQTGEVTVRRPGLATIYARATDGSGVYGQCQVEGYVSGIGLKSFNK